MRWAFWRRRTVPRPDPSASGTAPTPAVSPRPPAVLSAYDDAEDRRPADPFSGAVPQPGEDGSSLLLPGAQDLRRLLDDVRADPHLDRGGVSGDVVALVQAAVGRDRAAAAAVLRQLDARGAEGLGAAAVMALAALGDRLVVAAGYSRVTDDGEGEGLPEAPAGDVRLAAAVAQGDTVAERADRLLRTVAPQCPRVLVRSVVRLACGVGSEGLGRSEDLVLVAGVLLAQTVLDGQGDADALSEELAALLAR